MKNDLANNRTLLLTTLYDVKSVIVCITKFKIDELHILVDKPIHPKQEESIRVLQDLFKHNLQISITNISLYNIYEIAISVLNILHNYSKRNYNYQIIANITSGRRTQAFGIMYALAVQSKFRVRIVYVTKEQNEIIDLPRFKFNLNKPKLTILSYLKRRYSIKEIISMTNTTKANVYLHIRQLKELGLVNEYNELTFLGKLIIVSQELHLFSK